MLSDAIACIGFTWIASPACTELEVIMLDWLGKMLDLPKEFLACSGGKGGGVIQVNIFINFLRILLIIREDLRSTINYVKCLLIIIVNGVG
ncbi:aromatic-L-amino-acid decarboxylase-like [Ceratina calcarata]|uniref:Aromatic-L-amino-acid decarboxylase n=1 Tax=Ceratina calcarata TaxID=156304 RepID=A0AAJ7IZP7_9HYME|nr:aromatic-L-amino-acid decarboxylase-like [Ceratina calcarata]